MHLKKLLEVQEDGLPTQYLMLSMNTGSAQVYDLEQQGGSIIGGVIKLLRGRKNNPPAARDPSLPPKPKGQTVGSFREGLQSLPQAIARNVGDKIRCIRFLSLVDMSP